MQLGSRFTPQKNDPRTLNPHHLRPEATGSCCRARPLPEPRTPNPKIPKPDFVSCGCRLDAMHNDQLSQLIMTLTQAVERVRITVQLRRMQAASQAASPQVPSPPGISITQCFAQLTAEGDGSGQLTLALMLTHCCWGLIPSACPHACLATECMHAIRVAVPAAGGDALQPQSPLQAKQPSC